jgi:hypothetical protein
MMTLTSMLKRRLDRIEKAMPKPVTSSCPSVVPQIERWLANKGVVRKDEESLAETTARALGWSMAELRQDLQGRARG